MYQLLCLFLLLISLLEIVRSQVLFFQRLEKVKVDEGHRVAIVERADDGMLERAGPRCKAAALDEGAKGRRIAIALQ